MKITYQLSEIDSVAALVLSQSKSKLLLFTGEIGVGKTTLIKAIMRQLDSKDEVVSPSFAIVNEYHTAQDKIIYHFDLYRINDPEEVFQLGFEDYLVQGDWVFIEWPEIISDYMPDDAQQVIIWELMTGRRSLELCLKG